MEGIMGVFPYQNVLRLDSWLFLVYACLSDRYVCVCLVYGYVVAYMIPYSSGNIICEV